MNLNEIPTSIIIFIVGQTATAAWAIITTHFKVRSIEQKLVEIEKENHELKKELKEMRDILLRVEYATSQLMLGRIKTGQK